MDKEWELCEFLTQDVCGGEGAGAGDGLQELDRDVHLIGNGKSF